MIFSILFCVGAIVLSGLILRNEMDDGCPGTVIPLLVGEYLAVGIVCLLNSYVLEGVVAILPAIILMISETFLAWWDKL